MVIMNDREELRANVHIKRQSVALIPVRSLFVELVLEKGKMARTRGPRTGNLFLSRPLLFVK